MTRTKRRRATRKRQATWQPQKAWKPGDVFTLTTFERDGTRRSETRILDADGVTFRPLRQGEGG